MPTVINGAPGFGMGETRSEGRKAMYAKAKIVNAVKYRIAETQMKLADSTSIAPAGFRKRIPKKPNWSATRTLALMITSSQTSC
jgi:hypothetical protein